MKNDRAGAAHRLTKPVKQMAGMDINELIVAAWAATGTGVTIAMVVTIAITINFMSICPLLRRSAGGVDQPSFSTLACNSAS